MLGERLTNLLSLLSQDEFQTAAVLSSKSGLSTKTVRKFINQLNEILPENGAQILQKRGQGFLLEVFDFNKFHHLFSDSNRQLPNSSQERVRYLLSWFLSHTEYIKTDKLCDLLYVCKKTLAIDLKKTETILNEYGITLERKPYYGMRIRGDEFHIRLCMAQWCTFNQNNSENTDTEQQMTMNCIMDCLLYCLENENYRISDIALQNLVRHIYIAIRRIQSKQYIPAAPEEFREWRSKEEYRFAEQCTKCIGKKLNLDFPESEVIYVAIHLAGKQSGQAKKTAESNLIISSEINNLANQMLQEIYDIFHIDLRDDLETTMSLSLHLLPMDIRMRYGMKLHNPLLKEIKEHYSLAYIMAIQSCSVLERHYKKRLESNEISYIAIILALSLERLRTERKKNTILLVCSSGAGTVKLLEFKMMNTFGSSIRQIITCSSRRRRYHLVTYYCDHGFFLKRGS